MNHQGWHTVVMVAETTQKFLISVCRLASQKIDSKSRRSVLNNILVFVDTIQTSALLNQVCIHFSSKRSVTVCKWTWASINSMALNANGQLLWRRVLKSRMETHHKDDSCSAGSRGALWVLGNFLSNCMSPDKSIAEDLTFVIASPAFHPLRDLRRHIIPGTTSEADQDWFRMSDNSCRVLDASEDQQLSVAQSHLRSVMP